MTLSLTERNPSSGMSGRWKLRGSSSVINRVITMAMQFFNVSWMRFDSSFGRPSRFCKSFGSPGSKRSCGDELHQSKATRFNTSKGLP